MRFLVKLKETATQTSSLSCAGEKLELLQVFSRNYFRECYEAWKVHVEVRTASDGNSFEGDCIDKAMFRNQFRYLISMT